MRYLILLLTLANVAFFVWYPEVRSGPYSTPRLPPEPPNATQLVLLAERQKSRADVPADAAPTGKAPSGTLVPKLASSDAAASEPPVDSPAQLPATETVPEKPRLCRTVGPYFEERGARRAARTLTREKYEVRIRNGDIQAPAGYWVYLPANSAAEARKIVGDLDSQGMKDYFIGKDNVISLGIFSTRDTAEVRRGRIAKLGYPAMLDQRYRTRRVYWLDLEDGDNPLLINPVWSQLLKVDPNVAAQQVSCE